MQDFQASREASSSPGKGHFASLNQTDQTEPWSKIPGTGHVWIRTQRAAVASRRASNLATHLPKLVTHLPNLATHLPNLATHLPNLRHPSPWSKIFRKRRGWSCHLKFEKAAAVQYPGEEGVQRGPVHCLQARDVPDPLAGVQRRLTAIQLSRKKMDGNQLETNIQSFYVYHRPYFCSVLKDIGRVRDPKSSLHSDPVLRIWIRDLVPFWPMDPGWKKNRIRDKHPGSATLVGSRC